MSAGPLLHKAPRKGTGEKVHAGRVREQERASERDRERARGIY